MKAKLVINNEREFEVGEPRTSIGRASDNSISLSNDSNISRYHAEIEERDGEFWLVELGSSNGTTLNGEAVTSAAEKLLKDGDVILLGGSSEIAVEIKHDAEDEKAASPVSTGSASAPTGSVTAAKSSEGEIAKDAEKASKMPLMLMVTGVICGLAVIFVVAAVLFWWLSPAKKCEAVAAITSPRDSETISEETDVQAKIRDGECVGRAIFVLDGKEFASASSEPYKVSLNPDEFGELADGENHTLQVVLEDKEGKKLVQQNEILVVFETLATPTPTPEETDTPTPRQTPKQAQNKQISPIETLDTSKKLITQFSVKPVYKYDPQFLQEVQKKTAEYASEGYFARAQNYRDVIYVAFVQEQNLDASFGYLLAMSRSKFNPQKQAAEEGLWQMSNDFVTANSLNVSCGTETLSDASQNCAAKATALYLKTIVLTIFEGDPVYSVAAFGMSPQEAAAWKATLPADRSDFWKVIKSQKQRDEVVKFFAASVVAENPQKFGLKKDRPLSELYRIMMGK